MRNLSSVQKLRNNSTRGAGTSLAGSFDDRKACEVHDDLFAHALVLESGARTLAMVSLDLIVLPERHVAAARERIAARAGIPPAAVLIACTHTHSGPATTGLLGVDGRMWCVREDVGRHNAVDKAIGWAIQDRRLPLRDALLVVSGRWIFWLDWAHLPTSMVTGDPVGGGP